VDSRSDRCDDKHLASRSARWLDRDGIAMGDPIEPFGLI